jgi:hypothetical protein
MIAALAFVAAAAAAEASALGDVLARAGAYVEEFHRRVHGIVAEESYVQDALRPPVRPLKYGTREHRELRSDLLLVNVAGTASWMEFRDVFEVDGQPVRDRTDRLTQLFLAPSPTADQQIHAILAESARYNLGDISRTVNTPMFALAFLKPSARSHFRFFRSKDRLPAGSKVALPEGSSIANPFRVSAEVWVIRFEESRRPTFIRTRDDRDLPAHGRFWIEPDTGRVLMSEVVAEDRLVRGTLTVSYQSEPLLGMLLPAAMRERYEGRRTRTVVDAAATYGRFRQFQVNVDEKFLLKR